jgi:hypothetical protein
MIFFELNDLFRTNPFSFKRVGAYFKRIDNLSMKIPYNKAGRHKDLPTLSNCGFVPIPLDPIPGRQGALFGPFMQ